jgi:hypothetical protein
MSQANNPSYPERGVTIPDPAAKFAAMSDGSFFSITVFWSGEEEAYKTERAKRLRRIEQERARVHQERVESATKNNEIKNALPYSDQLAEEICERIASGELLTVICLDEHLPTVRRCNQWLRDHGEFAALYQSALSDRLSIFEEQIIQIPDEPARDFDEVKSKGGVRRVLDPGKLTAAKLRVEVRRLHLKAGKPHKWGDSTTLITKSDDAFDPSNMSPDELEKQIAEIEYKSRIRNVA